MECDAIVLFSDCLFLPNKKADCIVQCNRQKFLFHPGRQTRYVWQDAAFIRKLRQDRSAFLCVNILSVQVSVGAFFFCKTVDGNEPQLLHLEFPDCLHLPNLPMNLIQCHRLCIVFGFVDFVSVSIFQNDIELTVFAVNRVIIVIAADFILANTDRHLGNFGFLRDSETLEWKGTAPIYDSGTSLWQMTLTRAIHAEAMVSAKPFETSQQSQLKLIAPYADLPLERLDGCSTCYCNFQLPTICSHFTNRMLWSCFGLCPIKSKHLNSTTNSGGNFRGSSIIKLGGCSEDFFYFIGKSIKALQRQVRIRRNQL